MAGKFVIKKGRTGQFRFSLVGRNSQVVATSETYVTKASCTHGIKAVKTLAAGAVIEDQTSKATKTVTKAVRAAAVSALWLLASGLVKLREAGPGRRRSRAVAPWLLRPDPARR